MTMIVVHRGAGMLAPGFGLLFALFMNVLTFRVCGGEYYQEHRWPKLTVLIMSGIACLIAGVLIKRKRVRNAQLEQQAIDSLSQKHEAANLFAYHGPRDHLMYIPLQYWSIVYLAAAIIYILLGASSAPSIRKTSRISPTSLTHPVAASIAENEAIAQQVKKVITTYSRDKLGHVDSKEAIAAMAAVVGERCLDAAGEIPVRTHDFEPGQRAFSDKINELLTGDQATDLVAIKSDSVFGTIRDQLSGTKFQNHFPSLHEVFTGFAGGISKHEWGKVPLSVPAKYYPEKLPLRVAFDTRQSVDDALRPISLDKLRSLHVCTLAMIMMLQDETLVNQLNPAVALALTFETINGMAKTVPMKDKAFDTPTAAMRAAQHTVLRLDPQ
ncbi:MAG TPA: hypothetical protein VJ784_22930 [Pyrinomonadaceae bacterium]|nr:hypothetical protein [Pyrinomonadaceae bacterium]